MCRWSSSTVPLSGSRASPGLQDVNKTHPSISEAIQFLGLSLGKSQHCACRNARTQSTTLKCARDCHTAVRSTDKWLRVLLTSLNSPSHGKKYLFTILSGNADEQLLDTDAVRPCDKRLQSTPGWASLHVVSSRYRCDGAGLACNAQGDAELDPSEKLREGSPVNR